VIVTIAALVGDWSRLAGRAHPQELPLDEPEPPVAVRSVAANS